MEIVPFEIAKKLKEKGFDEVCYDYYEPLKHCLNQIKTPWTNKEGESYGVITAPTISQVLKWLREEKKISIEVGIHYSLKWMCGIYGFSDGLSDFTQYSNDGVDDTVYILYDSYELAALAGIEYVIDNNLI